MTDLHVLVIVAACAAALAAYLWLCDRVRG
jgi:hypothetical protein